MSKTVILSFVISFLISNAIGDPFIITQPVSLTKSVGDSVMLLCKIKDLTTEIVTWKYLDHNKIISQGDKLKIDNVEHYKIEIPHGDHDDDTIWYILHIYNLQTTDQGKYTCSVIGTNATVTHHLTINEAPPVPTPPTVHDYNFTDCCRKKSVSLSCQPVCDPFNNLPKDFDPLTNCAADLPKLIECGSDGKNHAPCCKRRGLPDICLDFCVGNMPSSFDAQHLECLNKSLEIIKCYEEGIDILPGPPSAVSAVAQASPVGFVVSWREPADNSGLVKGYYIHYKLSADTIYQTSTPIDKDTRTFSISGLMPNKIYAIYMSAFSEHGSSQPSEIITQPTIGGTSPVEHDLNIKACCSKTLMSQKCQDDLCKSNVFEDLDPTVVYNCYGYIDEALKCVSGHRNHTGCCQRNGIPDACLGFCSGKMPPLDDNLSQCMIRLPMIEACIMEGLVTLPGPPTNVELTKVTQTTATLQWTAPKNGTVKQYIIAYLEHDREGSSPNMSTTDNTTFQLTGLTPNTEYDVEIVSSNDAGTSLPSPNIGLLTYAVVPSVSPVTPSPGPGLPYDLSACCKEKGMSDTCMTLCDYGFIINATTADLFNIAIPCINDFGLVLTCGSDGRDHTQCCKERNVKPDCYQLCQGDFDGANVICALEAPKLAQCFKEGIINLPRPPSGVYIDQVTTHTITVSWSPPSTGPKAISYIVLCDGCSEGGTKVRTSAKSYILQNLRGGYKYNISVISSNTDGYSIPSPSLSVYLPVDDHKYNCSHDFKKYTDKTIDNSTVWKSFSVKDNTLELCKTKCLNATQGGLCRGFSFTQASKNAPCIIFIGKYGQKQTMNGTDFYARKCNFEIPEVPPMNGSQHISWKNQKECCNIHNVSAVCMPYCEAGNAFSDPQTCADDFSTTIACASDGKNHSSCCQQAGVPDSCLPLCWGAVMDKDHPVTKLCLSYTRMFITCFSLGQRTIPSIPQRFRVTNIGTTFIEVAWEKPEQNCDPIDCFYDIQYYGYVSSETKYNWTNTQKNLTNLQPETLYHISVSAVNKYGSSLSTPIIMARTHSVVTFEMNFYIKPDAVIDTGKAVTLICEVFGASDAVVSIKFKTKEISTERVYTILSATEANDGEYTCTVKKSPSDVTSIAKTLTLMVRYKPNVLNVMGDQVQPNAGKKAYLICIFEGLPMNVVWTKDGNRINYYTSGKTRIDADGKLTDTLQIYNVRRHMYGRYQCNGTNDFGYAVAHMELKTDYNPPTVIPPTYPPKPANESLRACCTKNGISGVCLELCSFDVDFAAIVNDKYDECLLFLPLYVTCATDNKNHSKCCDSRGVQEFCMPFCQGSTPDLSDTTDLLTCVAEATDIMECIEEGRVTIPYAPTNVLAVQQHDEIHVTWDPPKDGTAPINKYDIKYYTSIDSKILTITVAKDLHHVNIKNIPLNSDGTIYYVSVRSGNDKGDSLPASAKPVIISNLPPPAPKDLFATVDGTTVNLQWTPPSYTEHIAVYVVKYKVSAENSVPKELIVNGSTTNKATLTGLAPNTMYDIFVVARSANMVEGKMSNGIHITTGNTVTVSDKDKQNGESNSNGGIIAAVVIIILVLAGAAVAGVIYYRRGNKHRFSETVTFENPQYGSHDSQIKISGLPTDNSEDNPFGYSPLHEERDEHQYSSPMLNVDQVEFKPRK